MTSELLVGWTSIDSVFGQKGSKTYQFFKGTARNAITTKDPQPKGAPSNVSMEFEIVRADALMNVANLMPSSVLVGCDEILPGLKEEKLPNSKIPIQIDGVEVRELYIERVNLELSPDIQRAAKEECRRLRTAKYENIKSKVADVYVQEVKLFIYYHNGWTAVNREGFNNYISLRRIGENSYEYTGTFPLYDVFPHDLSCLVMQIELNVKVPLENSIEESQKIVLGWKTVFIDSTMMGKTLPQDKDLRLGPGKTLNGEALLELPGKTPDTHAKLRFDLNLTNIMNKSQLPQPSIRAMNTSNILGAGNNAESEKLREKLKNTREENDQLRQKYDEMANILKSKVDLEKESKRGASPVPPLSQQPQYITLPNQQGSGYSPVYEKQFLEKFDRLLASIDDIKNKQGTAPLTMPPIPLVLNGSNTLYQPGGQQNLGGWAGQSNFPTPAVDYDARARDARERQRLQTDGLSRVDQASYLGLGVGGLMDPNFGDDPAFKSLNLKIDEEDQRKISTIVIQFLGIKFVPAPGDPAMLTFRIPERVFLTFDFFTNPTMRTKNLAYLNINVEEIRAHPDQFANKLLPLANEDFLKGSGAVKEPMQVIEVNPIKEGSTGVHNELIRYLATKELAIDVWDGDSLMHFGKARTRLFRVLRQGKDSEIYSPSLEIIDEVKKEVRGVLQLSIKNQALMMDVRPETCPPEVLNFQFNRSVKGGRYKVKSFKPMDIQHELAAGFDGSRIINEAELQDEEHRKRLRIDRFKVLRSQMPAGPATSEGPKDLNAFKQSLIEVNAIRERKKPETIANALAKGFSEEHPISAVFGHPKFITYKFENVIPQRSDFRVKIEYGKNALSQEFTLVRDPNNWRIMAERLRCEKPPEWGMLETQDVFCLNGGDGITMIFKFLSFDQTALSDKPVEKIISISILDLKGQIICGIAFNFKLKHPIIDRTMTYYELENRLVAIELPPFNVVPTTRERPDVAFSDPSAVIEWVDGQHARVKVRSPAAPLSSVIYMFAYEDRYRSQLIGIYRLIVRSQQGFDVITEVGQVLLQRLNLTTDIRRMVRVFSDHPKMTLFDRNFIDQFDIIPGSSTQVVFKLRSFRPGREKITINVVDNFSKELVQGFTLMVNTNPVAPDRSIPLRVGINRLEPLAPEPFVNRLGEAAEFEVESSNPDVIQATDKIVRAEAGAKAYVSLRVMPQNKTGNYECFIFIVESQGRLSECWRYIITTDGV